MDLKTGESAPRTRAALEALRNVTDPAVAADVLFLEAWQSRRPNDLAATLRARQIRRANPNLAAAIHEELAGR